MLLQGLGVFVSQWLLSLLEQDQNLELGVVIPAHWSQRPAQDHPGLRSKLQDGWSCVEKRRRGGARRQSTHSVFMYLLSLPI